MKTRKIDAVKVGARFGRLVVIGEIGRVPVGKKGATRPVVVCQCDCGALKPISADKMVRGETTSCGCYRREMLLGGHLHRKHGLTETRLHHIWCSIHARTNNKKHPRYGGRGVTVCEEWAEFQPFYEWSMANGYADDKEIDRIDNDAIGYAPQNCRWTTKTQNCRNRSSNVFLTAFGKTKCYAEWAEDNLCSVNDLTLARRIRDGWEAEMAITLPPQKGGGRKRRAAK